jgi:hypothetical protein
MNSAIIEALRIQSGHCAELGSPFNAALLAHAAADLESGWTAGGLFDPWASAGLQAVVADAAALRFVGGLHDLVLAGEAPALAAAYPRRGSPGDPEAAWIASRPAVEQQAAWLASFMAHEPQTNEVRRSVCLIGGFLEVARSFGLPLRVFEIASSAGLNLNFDRYRYALGDAAWGPADAAVSMGADWSGPAPPTGARLEVVSRAACDRRPIDLADPNQRRRLMAYVWPDQFDRLDRIRAAIELALATGVRVDAADAVDWTASRVSPETGAATVLFHSVFWQYMPTVSQAALAQTIATLGGRARAKAPFAWLRMEPSRGAADMEVVLTLWPGGETRVLAEAHPHGAWVRWRG